MNFRVINSNDYLELDPEKYFHTIRSQLEKLNSSSLKIQADNTIECTSLAPVFLIGFPRSGTTLLDTILRTHTNIDVVEEQPAVNSAKVFLQKKDTPK